MPTSVRHAVGVQATPDGADVVTLTMSRAELIGLREVIAFLDFLGDRPSRSEGEDRVVDAFLHVADPLIPSLGTDDYGQALEAAWGRSPRGSRRPVIPLSAPGRPMPMTGSRGPRRS